MTATAAAATQATSSSRPTNTSDGNSSSGHTSSIKFAPREYQQQWASWASMDFIDKLTINPGRSWSFEQFRSSATSEFGLDDPGPPSSRVRNLRITAIRRLQDYCTL